MVQDVQETDHVSLVMIKVMRALARNDDAIADLRKGLTLGPNEPRKKQIESALQELGATP